MRTGGSCAGALKSESPGVRLGVATWASPCGVVAELQGVRHLLMGGGGIRGFGLKKEKKTPFKKTLEFPVPIGKVSVPHQNERIHFGVQMSLCQGRGVLFGRPYIGERWT